MVVEVLVMSSKARRRPSWKKNPNRFVKEVYQETQVIYGEDILEIIKLTENK